MSQQLFDAVIAERSKSSPHLEVLNLSLYDFQGTINVASAAVFKRLTTFIYDRSSSSSSSSSSCQFSHFDAIPSLHTIILKEKQSSNASLREKEGGIPWPLPAKLQHFTMQGFGLSSLPSDFASHLTSLVSLNLDNNAFQQESFVFPASLQTLSLSHNHIQRIDLSMYPQLRQFVGHYNQMVRCVCLVGLDNLSVEEGNPLLRVTFVSDNTQKDPNQKDNNNKNKNKNKNNNDSLLNKDVFGTEENQSYESALRAYFRLKHTYETKLKQKRQQIWSEGRKDKLSIPQIQARVRQYKPRCIQCGSRGGTYFGMENRKYVARCGAKSSEPSSCSLHIELYRGEFSPLTQLRRQYYTELQQKREEVILLRMNALFSYMAEKDVAKQFKRVADEFQILLQESAEFQEIADQRFTDEHQEWIRSTERELEETKQQMLNELTLDNRESVARLYQEKWMPLLLKLRRLKYSMMEMDNNSNHPSFSGGYNKLIQSDTLDFDHMDVLMDEPPSVISN